MVLFDLRAYDLNLEIDNSFVKKEYFFGDKIKGKINLEIKNNCFIKNLIFKIVNKSNISIILFEKTFFVNKSFLLKNLKTNIFIYDFEYVFKKPENLENTFFKTNNDESNKYLLTVSMDFTFRKSEICEKEIIVKDKA